MRSSLKEALERRGQVRNEGADHRPSGIPVDLVLEAAAPIEQPVSLVHALMGFGLDLRDAHDIVDRLASGERLSATLQLMPDGESPFSLGRFGIATSAPWLTDAATISSDVLSAIDTWRLSRPERPSRGEAISIILRRGLAAA